jgi:1-deoxy-D-xylulose-5-phosphate synthase
MHTPLLPFISDPSQLKDLDIQQLSQIADEARARIIEVMATNGGHLASNLGCVELTIALHKVFNSPVDKLIWDVSHQTYTHKLLTGRYDSFSSVRQHKGLCGFCCPQESPHDHFHAGHAGTALSLALGVAATRDLHASNEYVIPIIGDATLTCGMSLEALNNIPHDLARFIVILNDNAMSISKNVGAITHILSRIFNNPTTKRWQQEFHSIVSKIPYASMFAKQGRKLTSLLKNFVSPASFFEQYGVSYIGPIDGHDIHKLCETLESLKDTKQPVVLHVLTNKGHGMNVARENPISYHGAKPFCPNTGKFTLNTSTKKSFPEIFGHHMLNMADVDPNLMIVTPAMAVGSCLEAVMERHPKRCFDVGIAESHALTYAGGLAYGGKNNVVASIYSTFLQRAFDNLFHDICLQELPVVMAVDRAGISGPDGCTHHGIFDIAFLNSMPNMIIAQPRDGNMLCDLLDSAFSWQKPTAIRYPNLPTDVPALERQYRPCGKGEVISMGSDILIIALGHMCNTALAIRDQLSQLKVSATVMDPIFVKPLDAELLHNLLLTHSKIVTIEEHSVAAGLGMILNNFLITNGYSDIQVLNCGIPDAFVTQGSYAALIAELGLTSAQITSRIIEHFGYTVDSADSGIDNANLHTPLQCNS